MNQAGFVVIAFMLTAYVLLDGYDLGVGTISFFVGRTPRERAAVMESIGPFWNGNEVWLIAAGGALFALFPKAYASSFSGFYLPFIIVLWMLMIRGIAMELRNHFKSELWYSFWDVGFSVSSGLLILLFGVALGNLLRGVPLDKNEYFQGTFAFLLNPYSLLVGVFAVVALAQHAAAFLAMRMEGPPAARSLAFLRRIWWAVLALDLGVSAGTYLVRGLPSSPWLFVVPVVSLGALVAMIPLLHRGRYGAAFGASSLFVASLLVEAAGSLYPYLIPGYPLGSGGMTIFEATPSPVSLTVALTATIGGTILVVIYGAVATWAMAGKVRVE
ncbi:MAG TPA: cytochrome d ubiquinol oxidase subunit II [Candidatus Acidoferrales bacterium]|nr:cytochrome d ubiquinol oxidase subunit II [Candidatus Acidoferrales bacterium]